MLDRPDTYLLIGLFGAIAICWLWDAIETHARRVKRLEAENNYLRSRCNDLAWERNMAISRDEAVRSHYVLLRDGEIEQLRRENRTLRVIAGTAFERGGGT